MKIKSNQQRRICPICGQIYHEPPALSRADGKTQICPDCGTREALQSIGVCNEEQEKSSIPFISIQRIFECNIHNNPSEYLVHDRIPISVKVR
mgnify:CR=1 FL=1|jgi:ribosomal protein S27AE|nr:MAG TPA_asm: zinc-ribbon domain protein [Caudoviricetes sp.]